MACSLTQQGTRHPTIGLCQCLSTAMYSGSKQSQEPWGPWTLFKHQEKEQQRQYSHAPSLVEQTNKWQNWGVGESTTRPWQANCPWSKMGPAPCQEQSEHDHAHPHPYLALHKPGLRTARELSTILAQTTSIVSAGFRSDTKTPRSTRASSGKRSNRCSRSSCSGHRVILASCFWTSLALICIGMGQQEMVTKESPLLSPRPLTTTQDSPAPAVLVTHPSGHSERQQVGWLVGWLGVLH